jgi:RNA polymerase sigma-70 factor, ECF subfamily
LLAWEDAIVSRLLHVVARDTNAAVARDVSASDESVLLDRAMDRYAAGEDSAFGEVYDRLVPRLYGFLLRQTRDRTRAEDVVQGTMLRIHRARDRFEPGARVVPWAFAIARRLLVDSYRRGGREVLVTATGEDDEDPFAAIASVDAPADDVAVARELAARIAAELERLPENQRVAFELLKQEGLSVAEAAETLGTTASAVKLRAHRAYEALRAALGIGEKR